VTECRRRARKWTEARGHRESVPEKVAPAKGRLPPKLVHRPDPASTKTLALKSFPIGRRFRKIAIFGSGQPRPACSGKKGSIARRCPSSSRSRRPCFSSADGGRPMFSACFQRRPSCTLVQSIAATKKIIKSSYVTDDFGDGRRALGGPAPPRRTGSQEHDRKASGS